MQPGPRGPTIGRAPAPSRRYTELVALLVLVFVLVPLVEIWLLLFVGGQIGFWPTVGITLITALVGGRLASGEGRRVLGQWREALASGRVPDEGILAGVLILVGGVLLITPGILTDGLGLALLFPPTRRLIAGAVRTRLEGRFVTPGSGGVNPRGAFFWSVRVPGRSRPAPHAARPNQHDADVIDVEGESSPDEPPRQLPR